MESHRVNGGGSNARFSAKRSSGDHAVLARPFPHLLKPTAPAGDRTQALKSNRIASFSSPPPPQAAKISPSVDPNLPSRTRNTPTQYFKRNQPTSKINLRDSPSSPALEDFDEVVDLGNHLRTLKNRGLPSSPPLGILLDEAGCQLSSRRSTDFGALLLGLGWALPTPNSPPQSPNHQNMKFAVLFSILAVANAYCPNGCSGHGSCGANGA